MAVVARHAEFGAQVIAADAHEVDAGHPCNRLGVLDAQRAFDQHVDDHGIVGQAVGLRHRQAVVAELRQHGDGRAMAVRRKAPGGVQVGGLRGGLDARKDQARRARVEQPADGAVLALGHAHQRHEAQVVRRGADGARRVERDGAVFEVDPDRVVAAGLGQPGEVGRARQADAEGRQGLAAGQPLHQRVALERLGCRVFLRRVSACHAGIVGKLSYIWKYCLSSVSHTW
ncbi:hypothetical protein D3C86_1454140 [compost metagenome]